MTGFYKKMIGALIGLSRAAYSAPRTPELYDVLSAGLSADEPADEGEIIALTAKAAALKHQFSPNCGICANPCGRTDDYDLSRIETAEPTVRDQKTALLFGLQDLARRYREAPDKEASNLQPAKDLLLDGLCVLGEDYDAETLSLYVKKAAEIVATLQKSS